MFLRFHWKLSAHKISISRRRNRSQEVKLNWQFLIHQIMKLTTDRKKELLLRNILHPDPPLSSSLLSVFHLRRTHSSPFCRLVLAPSSSNSSVFVLSLQFSLLELLRVESWENETFISPCSSSITVAAGINVSGGGMIHTQATDCKCLTEEKHDLYIKETTKDIFLCWYYWTTQVMNIRLPLCGEDSLISLFVLALNPFTGN